MKKMNIIGSMQPSHCPSDVKLIRKYWPTRSKDCFIFRTLLDKGIHLAFGSDAPIEPLDPLAGIAAAVNRTAAGEKKPFHPEQRISAREAFYQFTAGAAYAVGMEDERGFLLPGYRADFIVLSDEIGKIVPARIGKVKILATFFDGKLVFKDKTAKLLL
jgi:predicted amidohydrolase YtcJ